MNPADDPHPLSGKWDAHYIAAARDMFPDITEGHDLAVGWKITNLNGTTHNGYYWRPVNAWHDDPILHVASAWNPKNSTSCPNVDGDGLCVATHIQHVTSGGIRLTESVGHLIVWPTDLAKSDTDGKYRVPWCVDVDTFSPLDVVRSNLANLTWANLTGANLTGVDLTWANLTGVDLTWANLTGVDLGGANLTRANLGGANLTRANLTWANLTGVDLTWANLTRAYLGGANLTRANLTWANLTGARATQRTLWPTGFDPEAAGVVIS